MKWAACFIAAQVFAKPYPIQFSIPEEKIVAEIPEKTRDFAYIIPGQVLTYIYNEESDYYADYQRSYFAFTWRKGGWDCLRHYEILANGCIPYFVDLDQCHPKVMEMLPKELILEAMSLPGVNFKHLNGARFDKNKYREILEKLLEYMRKHLTTKRMAEYILETLNYKGNGKILYLSIDSELDYLGSLTLIGLKQHLGDRVVDVPKLDHIYKTYSKNIKKLYGKGFTFSRIVDDFPVDREEIEDRIMRREFDLVIYGSVHRGTPYHELVLKYYKPDEIAYLCGDDAHKCPQYDWHNLFLREYY